MQDKIILRFNSHAWLSLAIRILWPSNGSTNFTVINDNVFMTEVFSLTRKHTCWRSYSIILISYILSANRIISSAKRKFVKFSPSIFKPVPFQSSILKVYFPKTCLPHRNIDLLWAHNLERSLFYIWYLVCERDKLLLWRFSSEKQCLFCDACLLESQLLLQFNHHLLRNKNCVQVLK